ncbi:MAG: hypothetical protein E3J72_03235 [Planctomycetota bacterium]|nr:MAG: hypothetical protein E3J72_03235 [Planctomycetota bacterium]
MRFTQKDFESVWPVADYTLPVYPTREQAGELGIDLYRIPDTAWKRFGRKALVGAILISMSNLGACPGCVRNRHPYYIPPPEAERCLTEAEARQIVLDRFAAEGVTFNQDYQYKIPFVEFNADGFDSYSEIGFEYYSQEDAELYDTLTKAYDWTERERLFLEGGETATLNYNMSAGSHAVKNFKAGTKGTLAEERQYLIDQVEEFISWLKAHGRL